MHEMIKKKNLNIIPKQGNNQNSHIFIQKTKINKMNPKPRGDMRNMYNHGDELLFDKNRANMA